MDIIDGEVIQPFNPATGKLNDSVLSGNVLVFDGNKISVPAKANGTNYLYLERIGGDDTQQNIGIKGSLGPGFANYSVSGGKVRIIGGPGGIGNESHYGNPGGDVYFCGGSGGGDGGYGSGYGGSIGIYGGPGRISGGVTIDVKGGELSHGSISIGSGNADSVTVGRSGKNLLLPGNVKNTNPVFQLITCYLGTPALSVSNGIKTSTSIVNGTINSFSGQMDFPRNITATITDSNNSIVSGTIRFNGSDVNGFGHGETWTFSPGVLTFTGSKIFAKITDVVVNLTGLSGDETIIIGFGNLIGLPYDISNTNYGQTGAVKHVFFGGARVLSPVIYSGVNSSAVDVSSLTYNGAKQLIAWVNPGV